MRWNLNMPPVWLIQSTTEIMAEYSLVKHSRKEKFDERQYSYNHQTCNWCCASKFPPLVRLLKNTEFGERITNIALMKNKITLLGAYNHPVRVLVSLASSLTTSRACSRTYGSDGNSHTTWNHGYHKNRNLN